MKLEFLPKHIYNAIELVGTSNVQEIRFRVDYPIKLITNNGSKYLTNFNSNETIKCKKADIDYVISYITEKSLYIYNDRIKQGYITTKEGVRVGVSGECVFSNGQIVTIKNFTSLNIRIPRLIKGCSNEIYKYIANQNGVFNTLIICAPGYGKTTMLKDLALKINSKYDLSILIIDERGEFLEVHGENIDKILYSDKLYAFDCALRSMSPNVVVCDELVSKKDWECVKNVSISGVKILASCHASKLTELKEKAFFVNGVFERYVFLRSFDKPGQIDAIFDGEFNKVL